MVNHPSSPPSRSHSHSLFDNLSFGEDIDLTVGVTSAAFSLNELYQATKDRRHRARHLLKAGLASAVSAGAFTMMHREHHDDDEHYDRRRSRSRSPSRGRHRDYDHFHSPQRRSRSSPDLGQDTNSQPENELPYPDSVKTQRGYSSDDESEGFGDSRSRRVPRMPFNYRDNAEKAGRTWSGHGPGHGGDGHESSSHGSAARRRRERENRYHRSPSPSPPRHRHVDVG